MNQPDGAGHCFRRRADQFREVPARNRQIERPYALLFFAKTLIKHHQCVKKPGFHRPGLTANDPLLGLLDIEQAMIEKTHPERRISLQQFLYHRTADKTNLAGHHDFGSQGVICFA